MEETVRKNILRQERKISLQSFTMKEVDLTYLVMAWVDYLDYKNEQVVTVMNSKPEGVEIIVPEIFAYITECKTCSVLPMIEYSPEPGAPPPTAGDPMMNSLVGSGIDADLCRAKSEV